MSADASQHGSGCVDIVSKMDALCVNKIVSKSFGCKLGPKGTACSAQFSMEDISEQRENCASIDKETLDMLVMGQFQAHAADTDNLTLLGRSILPSFSKASVFAINCICSFMH